MLDAYRGTIDDGGETLDDARNEVSKLFSGAYGTLDDASRVWRHRTSNMLVSATVITRDALGSKGGSPTHEAFLAFSLTHPTHQRQGLARMGLMHAMQTLRTRGEQRMHLVVTQGNTRAEALYTSMGFIKRA
jgi:ribosomal protein S18 acetylase RimI-like enzyme